MLAAVMPAALQHVDEALDVGIDVGVRVLERIAHAGLRCQINDDGEAMLREKRPHRRAVCQIELHEPEVRMALQDGANYAMSTLSSIGTGQAGHKSAETTAIMRRKHRHQCPSAIEDAQ